MGWGMFAEPAGILLLAVASVAGLGWLFSINAARSAKAEQAAEVDELERQLGEAAEQITVHKVAEAQLSAGKQAAEHQAVELGEKLKQSESTNEALIRELSENKSTIRELETRMAEERKAAGEKLALLDEAKQKLGNEFRLLAGQIFEEKGKAFSEQNRKGLDDILGPVREQLGEFRKRVDEVHVKDAEGRASLARHLEQLEKLNRQMSEDAVGLTQALKGESKAQGNWGEMILERILETSGLREGHEFAREQSFNTEDGRRLRPDVVIYMPGDKQVIIDSKVSLTDYERIVSAADDISRKAALAAHLRSLKSHIQGLAGKRYDHLPNVNTPDYVLMFVPIEAAYLMAIEADAGIFESAFAQRVAVVTPSTLYATLKLIEQLWRYERQSENVVKLIDRAGKLHDKMAGFIESFEEVGDRIAQAQKAYDTSLNRIKTGPGNVVSQIATLGKLAGKTQKELPKHLTETAALEDSPDEGKGS